MKSHFLLFLGCILFISCAEQRPPAVPMDMGQANLLPLPVLMTATGSSFEIKANTPIFTEGEGDLSLEKKYLSDLLKPATGFDLSANAPASRPDHGFVLLSLNAKVSNPNTEGYTLDINEDFIKIESQSNQGIFYGIQTLRQLLPLAVEAEVKHERKWLVPSGQIIDQPKYEWRGAMLDVARHFFTIEEVKTVIDYLAAYKMNRLHLHLTDDQGWRLEIKSWPKLTNIGGSTEVGGGPGGFYTQEEYKDIVAYAKARHIVIVPEIDTPGHTNAALASYPILNCNNKATELYTGTRVGFSSLCIHKDTTYAFLNDVIGELAALTPDDYIHIGGDEADATSEEDYIYFINKIQQIVKSHGKRMIGWDDITAAALESDAIAQHWSKENNAKKAVEQGLKIIMSPAKRAYLDMQYDSTSKFGLHWAAFIPTKAGYDWNAQSLYGTDIPAENIIGVEAPLWSETIADLDDAEYLFFPRLPGYAEMNWTQDSLRNWDSYKVRLGREGAKWDIWGVDYYVSPDVPWVRDSLMQKEL